LLEGAVRTGKIGGTAALRKTGKGEKMPSYHTSRVAEDLKRELTALLRELKDPRVAGKFLTVVRVSLSADAAAGKVYVSAMEGFDAAKEAARGLESACGYLRGELARRLHLRKAPELRFVADDSIAAGTEILRTMETLAARRPTEGESNEPD
jgi:ribosome-binding factor A